MISEKVLEELVRPTALREHLVSAAGPSLSTESRLQLLLAIIDANMDSTPSWLAQLAMNDPAEIVRYFAARRTFFKTPEDLARHESGNLFFGAKPTPENLALHTRASADTSELVRAAVNNGNELNYRTLTRAKQKDRLLFIRGLAMTTLGPFASWLEEAIDAGVSDEDLNECAREFFGLPRVAKDMEVRDLSGYADGMAAYLAGEGLANAWKVTAKAGPLLQSFLAYHLPTSLGLHTCPVDELAAVPEPVLSAFVYRSSDSKQIDQVLQLMREEPDRFPAEAVKTLTRADEDGSRTTSEDLAKARAQSAVDRSEVMLEAVLALQSQVSALVERVGELQEAASRKRGLFG